MGLELIVFEGFRVDDSWLGGFRGLGVRGFGVQGLALFVGVKLRVPTNVMASFDSAGHLGLPKTVGCLCALWFELRVSLVMTQKVVPYGMP